MDMFRRLPNAWRLLPLLLLFFFLALNSMAGDSPTMDEQNHLARGLAFLATGDPHFSLEHPPLINTLSALPVYLLTDVYIPLDDPSWGWRDGWYVFAERLLWQSGNDVSLIIFLARLPIVFVTIGMALVGYRFGRALWPGGQGAALFAAACLLFDPNLLAHGRYTTTDAGGAAFLLLATFLLWRLWQAEGGRYGRHLAAAAVGLGLAFSSKFSTLTFAPLFLLLAALPLYGQPWRWRAAARRLGQLAAAGGGSLLVVWAVYGFQWAAFDFQSPLLQALNVWRGSMPTFWAGVEQILFLSSGGRASYLWGQFSDTGFPLYFPIAFLVKSPLPLLLLLPAAAFILLRRQETRGRAVFLLLPAFLYFLLSMQSALNIGYRHLFPMLPLLYLLIAGLGQMAESAWSRLALGAAAVSILGSALLIHPHYLSYFNLAAGGPQKGGEILIDSNIDWGQDLIRLQRWLAANGAAQVKLSWFGSADPAYYGIAYEALPGVPRHFDLWWNVPFDRAQPPPGLYAISVSNLGEPPLRTAEKTVFAWFRARRPTARVGYSIYIYDVR